MSYVTTRAVRSILPESTFRVAFREAYSDLYLPGRSSYGPFALYFPAAYPPAGHFSIHEAFLNKLYSWFVLWSADQGGMAIEVCLFVPLTYGNNTTVSFHNFKSQNLQLSVSNPKNKYVAYVSVLSQISNWQGLGRKNKFEILKTDRTQ